MIPLPLEIHPAAIAEAQKAYRWYRLRSTTAANRFQVALDGAMLYISESPLRGTDYIQGTRYRLLRRFPYLIVYRELTDRLQVIAVAHARQRPGYWRHRKF